MKLIRLEGGPEGDARGAVAVEGAWRSLMLKPLLPLVLAVKAIKQKADANKRVRLLKNE